MEKEGAGRNATTKNRMLDDLDRCEQSAAMAAATRMEGFQGYPDLADREQKPNTHTHFSTRASRRMTPGERGGRGRGGKRKDKRGEKKRREEEEEEGEEVDGESSEEERSEEEEKRGEKRK